MSNISNSVSVGVNRWLTLFTLWTYSIRPYETVLVIGFVGEVLVDRREIQRTPSRFSIARRTGGRLYSNRSFERNPVAKPELFDEKKSFQTVFKSLQTNLNLRRTAPNFFLAIFNNLPTSLNYVLAIFNNLPTSLNYVLANSKSFPASFNSFRSIFNNFLASLNFFSMTLNSKLLRINYNSSTINSIPRNINYILTIINSIPRNINYIPSTINSILRNINCLPSINNSILQFKNSPPTSLKNKYRSNDKAQITNIKSMANVVMSNSQFRRPICHLVIWISFVEDP